ncbi:hypothetical protein HK098_003023 [Nowakowskiella sp. JEL0407]|nr:hypothetical protein HK098_003023 [Nowakowskiella sp. JEL0407]
MADTLTSLHSSHPQQRSANHERFKSVFSSPPTPTRITEISDLHFRNLRSDSDLFKNQNQGASIPVIKKSQIPVPELDSESVSRDGEFQTLSFDYSTPTTFPIRNSTVSSLFESDISTSTTSLQIQFQSEINVSDDELWSPTMSELNSRLEKLKSCDGLYSSTLLSRAGGGGDTMQTLNTINTAGTMNTMNTGTVKSTKSTVGSLPPPKRRPDIRKHSRGSGSGKRESKLRIEIPGVKSETGGGDGTTFGREKKQMYLKSPLVNQVILRDWDIYGGDFAGVKSPDVDLREIISPCSLISPSLGDEVIKSLGSGVDVVGSKVSGSAERKSVDEKRAAAVRFLTQSLTRRNQGSEKSGSLNSVGDVNETSGMVWSGESVMGKSEDLEINEREIVSGGGLVGKSLMEVGKAYEGFGDTDLESGRKKEFGIGSAGGLDKSSEFWPWMRDRKNGDGNSYGKSEQEEMTERVKERESSFGLLEEALLILRK